VFSEGQVLGLFRVEPATLHEAVFIVSVIAGFHDDRVSTRIRRSSDAAAVKSEE
jgi:hypothetical protein